MSTSTLVQQVLQKMKDDGSWLNHVEGIAGFQAIMDTLTKSKKDGKSVSLHKLPKAFVYGSGAVAGTVQSTTGSNSQSLTRRITIAHAISVVNSPTGDKAMGDAEELLAQTNQLLFGWSAEGFEPFTLSRNAEQLVVWRNNVIIYVLNIEAQTTICTQ